MDQVLAHSKNIGADECELIHTVRTITTVRITDSSIAEVKQGTDDRYGVRLIHQNKIASVQSTTDRLTESVDQAFEISKHVKPVKFWKGLPQKVNANKINKTFDKRLQDISAKNSEDMAQDMINSALDRHVSAVTGSLNIVSEHFEIENTHGLQHADDATYIAGMINADSEESTIPVSGIGHCSARTITGFCSGTNIGKHAKEMCIGSINPVSVEPGLYQIIFEPYAIGELLSFVVAPNFNLKIFHEHKSCFSDKMNERIAPPYVNMSDDPHMPDKIGSKSVDDEGVKTQRKMLIKDGIIKGTFSNTFDAYRANTTTSGNATRPGTPMGRSSEPIPDSATHNITIEPGNMTSDEMIKDVRCGLLIGRLWYTYPVNPIRGDFSCTARSGIRIIKNGKIIPAKPVRIIHNIQRLLEKISGIGNNQTSILQWAARPSVTPSVKVDSIPVEAL